MAVGGATRLLRAGGMVLLSFVQAPLQHGRCEWCRLRLQWLQRRDGYDYGNGDGYDYSS
jgi:hypothetical protein